MEHSLSGLRQDQHSLHHLQPDPVQPDEWAKPVEQENPEEWDGVVEALDEDRGAYYAEEKDQP
jgi:hypothetical protein